LRICASSSCSVGSAWAWLPGRTRTRTVAMTLARTIRRGERITACPTVLELLRSGAADRVSCRVRTVHGSARQQAEPARPWHRHGFTPAKRWVPGSPTHGDLATSDCGRGSAIRQPDVPTLGIPTAGAQAGAPGEAPVDTTSMRYGTESDGHRTRP